MSSNSEEQGVIDRREAIRRVSVLLGGTALVGGSALMSACEKERARPTAGPRVGEFTSDDVAFLDEVAETILPETTTPGAKAAQVGAFMALMVTDTYDEGDRKVFRDGMRQVDDATRKAHNVTFMAATPAQRLAVLESLDREQKAYHDALEEKPLSPQGASRPDIARTGSPDANPRAALDSTAKVTSDEESPEVDRPAHYFRMMKQLALLGYFTSEVGYTKALRYIEAPGRFDPCLPYVAGEVSWASHA